MTNSSLQEVRLPPVIDAALVDQLRVRMERKFRDLEIAEARGMPRHVIDRMFDAYMLAFREYDAAYDRLHPPTR